MASLHATFGSPISAYPDRLKDELIEGCQDDEKCRLAEIDGETWMIRGDRVDDYAELGDE